MSLSVKDCEGCCKRESESMRAREWVRKNVYYKERERERERERGKSVDRAQKCARMSARLNASPSTAEASGGRARSIETDARIWLVWSLWQLPTVPLKAARIRPKLWCREWDKKVKISLLLLLLRRANENFLSIFTSPFSLSISDTSNEEWREEVWWILLQLLVVVAAVVFLGSVDSKTLIHKCLVFGRGWRRFSDGVAVIVADTLSWRQLVRINSTAFQFQLWPVGVDRLASFVRRGLISWRKVFWQFVDFVVRTYVMMQLSQQPTCCNCQHCHSQNSGKVIFERMQNYLKTNNESKFYYQESKQDIWNSNVFKKW